MSGYPLLFFDISSGELLIILLVVFLVFGPGKIPEIARSIGKVMNNMKKATNDITREIKQGSADFQKDINPLSDELNETVKDIKKEINDAIDPVYKNIKPDKNKNK
jgi:TatA/E family protein of Tat protein translocase